jgi:hypothetical protein
MPDGDLQLYPLWPALRGDMLLSVVYPEAPLPHYISVGQLSAFIAGGSIALPLAIAQGGTASTSAAAARDALGAAPLASPVFTGTPAAPTQLPGDNSTRLATTAFVATAAGAPSWDNILNKPASFPPTLPIPESGVTGLVADLAAKAPLASPALTGTPTSTTPGTADSSTRLATTSYVQAQTVALTGDVTASALLSATRTATVTGLQGRPLAATAPTANQVWQWSGTQWQPATLSTAAAAAGTAGQIQWNSAGALAGFTMSGDATLNTATGALSLATPNANVGTFQGLTINAKGLVTAAAAQGYLTANQTITLGGDLSGSGTTAITATLATVNANVGTFQGLTINAKGLVTAASNQSYLTGNQTITLSGAISGSGTTAITTTLATVPIGSGGTGSTTAPAALTALGAVPLAGGTMTGDLVVPNVAAGSFLPPTGAAGEWAQFGFTNGNGPKIQAYGDSSGGAGGLYFYAHSNTETGHFDSAGNLTIAGGTATKPGGGSWVAPSDRSLKSAIEPWPTGLQAVLALEPIAYRYNDETWNIEQGFIGLDAADAAAVIPEMARTITLGEEATETAALDHSPLVFALVNAVRELASRVEELEARPSNPPAQKR